MSGTVSEATILVPIDASDPGEPPESLVELLGPHSLVILGYYPVPDQSSTDQLRSQFGEEATDAIEAIADRFARDGDDVESTVVFTRDRSGAIDRAAADHGVDAVLTAATVDGDLDRVLVPLRGEDNLERIVAFVSVLLAGSEAEATLFNVAESADDASQGEFIVRGARDRLAEDVPDPDRLDWRQEVARSSSDGILAAAEEYDLLVVGESQPSLRERILGDVTDRIIEDSPCPVLIVRNR